MAKSSLPIIQVLLVVGAGTLLNLTPCVLTAIQLKVRAVRHESGQRLAPRALSAALLAAGSVLFFAALMYALNTLQSIKDS